MKKHNFKIGDRVKACSATKWKKRLGDTVGKVEEVNKITICVLWDTSGCILCGVNEICGTPLNVWCHLSDEIELAVKVGEQLLFDFMN